MSYDAALLFYMLLIVYSPETSKQSRVRLCLDAVVRHGTAGSRRLSRPLASGSLSSVKHDDGAVCFEVRKGDSFIPSQCLILDQLRDTSVHVSVDDPIKATQKHVRLGSTKHLA
jgi:hypothetical protein